MAEAWNESGLSASQVHYLPYYAAFGIVGQNGLKARCFTCDNTYTKKREALSKALLEKQFEKHSVSVSKCYDVN